MDNPTSFISYAWESEETKKWVKQLATQLREDGIDAKLDQWEVVPGDQMPHFMEKSVRENDFVLIICTPSYQNKSQNRKGGVGYEGDIMTAEVLQTANQRKFIPILKSGSIDASIPSWLKGKYFLDFSNEHHYELNYPDLKTTLLNQRESAPKLASTSSKQRANTEVKLKKESKEELIKIRGIIVDEVTEPLNDGTRGSALYNIPFELNQKPDYEWKDFFIQAWNRPPQITSMHRPGIASVAGNKIYLNGTTIEEVEKYHKKTLKLAVDVANKQSSELKAKRKGETEIIRKQQEDRKRKIDDISKRINFD